jgi:hypothetical protein
VGCIAVRHLGEVAQLSFLLPQGIFCALVQVAAIAPEQATAANRNRHYAAAAFAALLMLLLLAACCLLLAACCCCCCCSGGADVLVKEAREKGGKTKIQLARGSPKYRTDFVPEASGF